LGSEYYVELVFRQPLFAGDYAFGAGV